MTMNWSIIWHGIIHAALSLIALAVPFVLMQNYSWESWTIGGVLAMIANVAKLSVNSNN